MIEIENDIIKKYQYKDYVIYAKYNEKDLSYEYYLQNEEYGIIDFMFGIPKSDVDFFEEIVLYDVENYIDNYKKEFED